jgi:hypothetical protein
LDEYTRAKRLSSMAHFEPRFWEGEAPVSWRPAKRPPWRILLGRASLAAGVSIRKAAALHWIGVSTVRRLEAAPGTP